MGLLSTLLERRDNPEDPRTPLSKAADWLFEALGATKTDAGITVSWRTALTSSAVYSCVNVLAQTIAQLPWDVYRKEGKRREIADARAEHFLLHNEPNPEMTSYGFRYCMMAATLLRGNFFAELPRDGAGRVRAIVPLVDGSVDVLRDSDGRLIGYEYRKDAGGSRRLAMQNVIHIPCIALDGTSGLSVIAQARQKIALELAAEKFGARFFGDGARPAGVLEYEGNLKNPEKRKEVETEWNAHMAGIKNSNKTAVLTGGMKWKPITMPPDEAQFIETRKFQVEDIARMFRVPGILIGVTDKTATYASVEQFLLSFEKFSIQPWLQAIEQEFNRKLFPNQTALYSKLDSRGLLRGDLASRTSSYNSGIQNGYFLRNEVRAWEDMNPIEGGDIPMVQGAMTPVDAEGKPMAQQPTAPQEPDQMDEGDAMRVLLPLFEDAVERVARKKASSRDPEWVKARFGPLVAAVKEMSRRDVGQVEVERIVADSATWEPANAQPTAKAWVLRLLGKEA